MTYLPIFDDYYVDCRPILYCSSVRA